MLKFVQNAFRNFLKFLPIIILCYSPSLAIMLALCSNWHKIAFEDN